MENPLPKLCYCVWCLRHSIWPFLSSFFIYKIVATITNEIERKHDHYLYTMVLYLSKIECCDPPPYFMIYKYYMYVIHIWLKTDPSINTGPTLDTWRKKVCYGKFQQNFRIRF